MKRLILVIAALAGGAWWWLRRVGQRADSWRQPDSTAPALDSAASAPPLGGDLDPTLLEILACPVDRQAVTRVGHFLVCGECQRHYPIRDGIPVMLVDEALTPEQARSASR